jgi:hypothetical protein
MGGPILGVATPGRDFNGNTGYTGSIGMGSERLIPIGSEGNVGCIS